MPTIHELLRRDALTFVRRAHLAVHQSALTDEMYLRLLAYDLERILSGAMTRYICNMPPGHGKTFVFSIALPAWLLGHKPSARILSLSLTAKIRPSTSRRKFAKY